MRTIFLLFLVLLGAVYAAPAQAAWWHFFFPSLRPAEYNPYATLKAPFARPANAPDSGTAEIGNAQDLRYQHRNTAELSAWLGGVLPEIMSFNEVSVADKEKYFDDGGLAQFQAFLNAEGIQTVMESGQYEIHAVMKSVPQLLNEGSIDNRYRWLYEAELMVTTLQRNLKDYKNVQPVNQNYTLNIQIGRNPQAQNEHQVIIEQFSGRKSK